MALLGNIPVTLSVVSTARTFATQHLFACLIAFILIRCLYKRYFLPLRHFPGPPLASVSRLWRVWSVWTGKNEEHYISAHRKYGPVVRTAPNELSFSSATTALDIFKTGKGLDKTDFYGVFPPLYERDIFTEARESVHRVKKRYASPGFSLQAMQQSTPRIEEAERLLLCKLDEYAHGNKTCDLGDWLHFFAFDVLGEAAFSTRFGFLEAGFDVGGAMESINRSNRYSGIVGQIPGLDPFLRRNPLRGYISYFASKMPLITRIALDQLESRVKPGNQKFAKFTDLLNSTMQAQKQNPEALSHGDVFGIAHGAIFAGSDSTASTMQSFMWHVLSQPRVHNALAKEIMSASLSEMVQYDESQKLHYFQACLKEAMRVSPAVGLNISRRVPPTGAEIGGLKLSGGTEVAVNGWVVHRDKQVFGQDADNFRPERWLEADKDTLRFGGGSHVCLGRHLALLEMSKVLPELFRRYHLQLVNPDQPLQRSSTFFVVQSGLHVHLKLREMP
ncbi:uncharacterized protein NECHADRAFT_52492 [Fusarium vanettenii 77-13-4]|uniref:Cytochrome P450 n=1 Tax=Fusarium vanettenii (strain ATCC MYA-4622 / CBS 123669 / FGSC 9596 / NRRL 45880 / 77-13-4) TaxID=660122 RepID=C7ZI59_FUSV7|nr:uncharacterized protein NECHADRAFT_52492 [Fusarium vanettenii 77-13-4]EEU36320.1 hypothetical protein NECHADRAFT_52492 [Fusarium vanettenii 77-13-4]